MGQKRQMSYQLINKIYVKALQKFDTYDKLNRIQISIKSNKITAALNRYKIYKYFFLVDSILFSSAVTNDTNVVFITCNELNEAKAALINGKLFKIFGVISLIKIRNQDLIKGESKWINAVLINSEYPWLFDPFAFAFNTKNANDILHFSFSLLDGKGDLIKFLTRF